MFLYSQDLSNYKTFMLEITFFVEFLYSQDLSNYKTNRKRGKTLVRVFVLSRFK